MIDESTQVVTATQDASVLFCSETKKTVMYRSMFLNIMLIFVTFPCTQTKMTRSKDCALQCSFQPSPPLSWLHNSAEDSSSTPDEEFESFNESDIDVDSDTVYHCDTDHFSDHLERYFSLVLSCSVI